MSTSGVDGAKERVRWYNEKILLKLKIKKLMNKIQKIWMWIFIAMFAIPEILFSFVLSFVEFFGMDIIPLYSFFFKYHFFIDHPVYLLIAEAIEWIGVLGLLIMSVKSNKKILTFLLFIILLWISINFSMGYIIANMSIGL